MTTAGSREINVTPLIDVLLVLLIIFIVIMPIMLKQETVELPPKDPGAIVDGPAPLVVKLDADLSVTIEDGAAFPAGELARQLRKQLHAGQSVFVDFVSSVPWREVIGVVDSVHGVATEGGRVAVRIHDDDAR